MSNILLKKTNGTEGFYLFYSPKQGLCCCGIRDGLLGSKEVVLENVREDFDAVIDQTDRVHIVCQDRERSILHLFMENGIWNRQYLLRAKKGTEVAAGNFRIICRYERLSVIYCMEHAGKKLLCVHENFEKNPSPFVLDELEAKRSEFAVVQDNGENLLLCYYNPSAHALGTRRYHQSQKRWEEFLTVAAETAGLTDVSLYADRYAQLHLCYKNGAVLYYKKHTADFRTEAWGETIQISRQNNEFPAHPAFWENGKNLLLCWQGGTNFGGLSASLPEGNWERIQESLPRRNVKMLLFRRFSALDRNVVSVPVYGFISGNKVTLFGCEEWFAAEAEKEININGAKIGVREIKRTGSEVEAFANYSSASSLPGNREEIEREKQRIREIMGQPMKSEENFDTGMGSEEEMKAYFSELIKKEQNAKQEAERKNIESPNPRQAISENETERLLATLEKINANLEACASSIASLTNLKNKTSGIRRQKNVKLAIVHKKRK